MCHTRLMTVSKVTAGLEDSLDRPISICSRSDIGCTVVKSKSCVETCSEPAGSICTAAVAASERCQSKTSYEITVDNEKKKHTCLGCNYKAGNARIGLMAKIFEFNRNHIHPRGYCHKYEEKLQESCRLKRAMKRPRRRYHH